MFIGQKNSCMRRITKRFFEVHFLWQVHCQPDKCRKLESNGSEDGRIPNPDVKQPFPSDRACSALKKLMTACSASVVGLSCHPVAKLAPVKSYGPPQWLNSGLLIGHDLCLRKLGRPRTRRTLRIITNALKLRKSIRSDRNDCPARPAPIQPGLAIDLSRAGIHIWRPCGAFPENSYTAISELRMGEILRLPDTCARHRI